MGNRADVAKTAITALAAGGQTGATKLAYGINRISVCATLGDSVMLPPALAGMEVVVINAGAQPCQVFGDATGKDTINGVTTATGIPQGINTIVSYICSQTGESVSPPSSTSATIAAGNWEVSPWQIGYEVPIAQGAAAPAINPHTPQTIVFNRAGAVAATLAAPTAGGPGTGDDGLIITITSDTAQAHTLTATALLDTGSANAAVATFAAQKGSGLTLMAFNARWKVLSQIGITFT